MKLNRLLILALAAATIVAAATDCSKFKKTKCKKNYKHCKYEKQALTDMGVVPAACVAKGTSRRSCPVNNEQ